MFNKIKETFNARKEKFNAKYEMHKALMPIFGLCSAFALAGTAITGTVAVENNRNGREIINDRIACAELVKQNQICTPQQVRNTVAYAENIEWLNTGTALLTPGIMGVIALRPRRRKPEQPER